MKLLINLCNDLGSGVMCDLNPLMLHIRKSVCVAELCNITVYGVLDFNVCTLIFMTVVSPFL